VTTRTGSSQGQCCDCRQTSSTAPGS
jgi:hypothetical protein